MNSYSFENVVGIPLSLRFGYSDDKAGLKLNTKGMRIYWDGIRDEGKKSWFSCSLDEFKTLRNYNEKTKNYGYFLTNEDNILVLDIDIETKDMKNDNLSDEVIEKMKAGEILDVVYKFLERIKEYITQYNFQERDDGYGFHVFLKHKTDKTKEIKKVIRLHKFCKVEIFGSCNTSGRYIRTGGNYEYCNLDFSRLPEITTNTLSSLGMVTKKVKKTYKKTSVKNQYNVGTVEQKIFIGIDKKLSRTGIHYKDMCLAFNTIFAYKYLTGIDLSYQLWDIGYYTKYPFSTYERLGNNYNVGKNSLTVEYVKELINKYE